MILNVGPLQTQYTGTLIWDSASRTVRFKFIFINNPVCELLSKKFKGLSQFQEWLKIKDIEKYIKRYVLPRWISSFLSTNAMIFPIIG